MNHAWPSQTGPRQHPLPPPASYRRQERVQIHRLESRGAVIFARAARGERNVRNSFDPNRKFCRRVSSEMLNILDRALTGVEAAILDYETFNQGLLFALYALWDAFLDAEEAKDALILHPAIEKTHTLPNHPEGEKITAEEIARTMNITPHDSSALFRREVGQTVLEYRNGVRLQTFFEPFEKEPSTNLSFLALESGFGATPNSTASSNNTFSNPPRRPGSRGSDRFRIYRGRLRF